MTELPPGALERLLGDARPLLGGTAGGVGLLHGRYRVLREVGRGGMGVVYEAEDVALRRRVALKVLALPAHAGPGLAGELLREARAAARLYHPGIAAVHDAHQDDRGGAIAMQFVDGVVLSSLPRGDHKRLVRLVRDAALAVQHAHEQGIVHRDLKPHNLLVTGSGDGERVVVTDFGLAKELALESSLSLSGRVLGTPAYMPPEQAGGRAREVDGRSDVYALGATLYDLLAGRPPFVDVDLVVLLRRVVEEEPPSLRALSPAVPRDLALVVHKCLAKEKERRYPSARELAEDLSRWLAGAPVRAQPPSWRYRAGKFARRHRALVAGGSAALVVALGALALTLAERGQRRASERALALSEEVDAVLRDARLLSGALAREATGEGRRGERESALARIDGGIAAARAFLERHDVGHGHERLGRLLLARGKPAEALASLDRALELDPGLELARVERGLVRAALHAEECAGLGLAPGHAEALPPALRARREQALADLSAVDQDSSVLDRVQLAHARAELARLRGEPELARHGFEEVLRLDPLSIEARVALSQLESQLGDPEAARARAMSALDLLRGLGPAYVAPREAPGEVVARAVRQLEQDAARAELDRAVAERPFDAERRALRGFHLLENGEVEEGRADLQAALFLGASDELRERIEAGLEHSRPAPPTVQR